VEALIPVHLRLLLGSHVILQHLLFSVELQSAKELKSNRLRFSCLVGQVLRGSALSRSEIR
jgi:hypothetical protein